MSHPEQFGEIEKFDDSVMNPSELHLFNQFEELEIEDPYLAEVITQAVELETQLNAKPYADMTEMERLAMKFIARAAVQEMNEACDYFDKMVTVTGEVLQTTYNEATEQYEHSRSQTSARQLLAKGYQVLLTPGDDGQSRYTVGHYFQTDMLPAIPSTTALVEEVRILHAFAKVGTVEIEPDDTKAV